MIFKNAILSFAIALVSCQTAIQNRDQEAINLVQHKKFGPANAAKISMLILMRNSDPNNMEVASMMAEDMHNTKFKWETKRLEGNTYCVIFTDKGMKNLLAWEANLDNGVVLCIPCDPVLVAKYKQFITH